MKQKKLIECFANLSVGHMLPIDGLSTMDDLNRKRDQLVEKADSLTKDIDAVVQKLMEKPLLNHILISRLRNDKLILVTLEQGVKDAKTEFTLQKLEDQLIDAEAAIEQYLKKVESDIGFVPAN